MQWLDGLWAQNGDELLKFAKATLAFALLCFVAGTLLAAWAYKIRLGETVEWVAEAQALPPPGQSVRLRFRPSDYNERYRLTVNIAIAPTTERYQEIAAPACDIEGRFFLDDQLEYVAQITDKPITARQKQLSATFGSEPFELSPGHRTVLVRNNGCEDGYDFAGGSVQVKSFELRKFSRAALPANLAMLAATLGLILTLLGSLLYWRGRRKRRKA